MGDLEEFSEIPEMVFDPKGIFSDPITGFENKHETIFNIMVAESLRGVAFNDIGDIVNICISKDLAAKEHERSEIANIAADRDLCFHKAKARVVATSRKIPGFKRFSGYK